jgi:hypothetical protein
MTADSRGRVTFVEDIGSGGTILSEQGGVTPDFLAAAGDPAPGLQLGEEFFQVGSAVTNVFGQVAFGATLSGPGVDTSNDGSLWIFDPIFGMEEVSREAGTVRIGPSDIRSIESMSWISGSSLQDGGSKYFNPLGEFAYLANFDDGNSALLVGSRPSSDILHMDGFESGDTSAW